MELSEAEKAEEVRFINEPELWPMWPYLPLKTINQEPRVHAVLHYTNLTRVFLVGLYDMTEEKWKAAEKIDYASVEVLVEAGWIVD